MNEKDHIFSKDEFIKNYQNLTSLNPIIKNKANNYLLEFKKSNQSMNIAIEMVEDTIQSTQLLGSIILHQVVKEKSNEILNDSTGEIYRKFHSMIFSNLIKKYKKTSEKVIEMLCCSMSCIMNIGLFLKQISISEMLEFSQQNDDNELITLFILGNIEKELSELKEDNFSYEFFSCINSILKSESKLILDYVEFLLKKYLSNGKVEENYKIHIKLCLNLILSWKKNGLFILSNTEIKNYVFRCLIFSDEFSHEISEIYSKELFDLPDSRKYEELGGGCTIDEIISNCNAEDLRMVIDLFNNLKFSIQEYHIKMNNNSNICYSKVYRCFVSIFASILENFGFFIFVKQENLSQSFLELLQLFIACPNKAISARISPAMNEIRQLVCLGFKLDNLEVNEKKEFYNYLIKLIESILCLTRLNSLKLTVKVKNSNNDNSELSCGFSSNEIYYLEDFFDDSDVDDMNENGLSVSDYRKDAEDLKRHAKEEMSFLAKLLPSLYYSKNKN